MCPNWAGKLGWTNRTCIGTGEAGSLRRRCPARPRRPRRGEHRTCPACDARRTGAGRGVYWSRLQSEPGPFVLTSQKRRRFPRAGAARAVTLGAPLRVLGRAGEDPIKMQELKAKDVLTTGEVARIC